MIDAIINNNPLPKVLIIEAMKMLLFACDDMSITTVQNSFKKAHFSNDEKSDDSEDPFSALKHSIEQLQSRDEALVPDDVTCDDVLTFDDKVAVTQDVLTEQMIVAEMRANKSDTKEEEEKELKQNAHVSLMEKPCVSQVREALNPSFKFVLITEIQHIAIKHLGRLKWS